MRKKELKQELSSLHTDLETAKNNAGFWKRYAEFSQEKLEDNKQLREENLRLNKLLVEVTSDLNALRQSSGFVHAYCAYDGWLDKEYCDRCRENGYNDWKWRGVLKNEENH